MVLLLAVATAVVVWLLEPSGRLAGVLVAFTISAMMMYQAIPNILAISYRKKLYDQPDGRRIHKTPISRLGGVAFLPIICCSVILTVSLYVMIFPSYDLPSIRSVVWICPLIIIFMVGVIDDLIGVRAQIKLLTQIIAAVLLVWSGLWIDNLGGLFGIHNLPAAVGMPFTVLFVVTTINAMNMIDGVDGLAAGLSVIAFTIYGVYCYLTGSLLMPLLAAAVLGTLVPYWYANVRGIGSRHHRLFMGDTGSQTMGLIISIFAIGLIMDGGRMPVRQNLVLALSPLIVPVFDLIHVAVLRLSKGKHPFMPDMTHIHHRLMQKGFAPRRTVMIILGLSAAYTFLNMILAPLLDVSLIVVADIAVWCVFNSKYVITNKPTQKATQTTISQPKTIKNV